MNVFLIQWNCSNLAKWSKFKSNQTWVWGTKDLSLKIALTFKKRRRRQKSVNGPFFSAFRSRISYRRHDRRPRLSSRTWPRPLSIFSTLTETRGRWQERRSSTASIAGGRKSPSRSFFKKKIGHSLPLFIYFRLFNTVDSKQVNKCSI